MLCRGMDVSFFPSFLLTVRLQLIHSTEVYYLTLLTLTHSLRVYLLSHLSFEWAKVRGYLLAYPVIPPDAVY